MAKTWVLHTDTKGTGAQMVPLESVTTRRSAADPVLVPRKARRTRQPPAPEAKPSPRRFKVVDLMTRQTLADGASAREVVGLLTGVRSVVDVSVYVWQEERNDWRLLTLSEQQTMWEIAHGTERPTSAPG